MKKTKRVSNPFSQYNIKILHSTCEKSSGAMWSVSRRCLESVKNFYIIVVFFFSFIGISLNKDNDV